MGANLSEVGGEFQAARTGLAAVLTSLAGAAGLTESLIEQCQAIELLGVAREAELLLARINEVIDQARDAVAETERMAARAVPESPGDAVGRPSIGARTRLRRPRDPRRVAEIWDWAEAAYREVRADVNDTERIARRLAHVRRPHGRRGFTRLELEDIKAHVFFRAHPIVDYDSGAVEHRRFDANPHVASAWSRLADGDHRPQDLVLLEHEAHESAEMRADPRLTYQEAHRRTRRLYDWVPGEW